jgi:hypothetical protein
MCWKNLVPSSVCFRTGNSITLKLKEMRTVSEVSLLEKWDSISLLKILKLDKYV